jgi:hypothetical protein
MTASGTTAIRKPQSDLVTLAESDLLEISGFIAAESGRARPEVEAHLRWFLLQNPARTQESPLGFGLRAEDGQLVGCLLCHPQTFCFQHQRIPVMGSSCFYVNRAYRGSGALIFLKYSRLTDRWPLFGNSANAEAASLWKGRGATPIPNSDRELIGVMKWSPVLEDVIYKKVGRPAAPRFTGSLASSVVSPLRRLKLEGGEAAALSALSSADQVVELDVFDSPQYLTAMRDVPYLRWRYFSGRDRSVAVFAFRKGNQRPVLVAVNQRPRGYRGQIDALYVLDLYPPTQPETILQIVSALSEQYRGKVDVIVLRCLDASQQSVLRKAGFLERNFDAPNGWFLDKRNLLPTREWYLVPGDGDWVI